MFYARTRDAAIKCLVMFDIFKDAICIPKNEFYPKYSVYFNSEQRSFTLKRVQFAFISEKYPQNADFPH